jgi:predicted RecA/RadA family phage recombinase
MARNTVRERAFQVSLPVAEGTKSGDPVVVGSLVGVALIDRGKDTEGEATIQMVGSFKFSVEGKKGGEEKAIAVGEPVYVDPATKKISADSSKTLFGYALQAVAKGKTEEVEIKIATS